MFICSVFASDSGNFLFCFVELRDNLTVTKSTAKLMQILKMVGELSTTTILFAAIL